MYPIIAAGLLPILLTFLVDSVNAQVCNSTQKCPTETPCCSPYGYCGTDSYCLGNCHPYWSHSLDSCKPMPICQNKDTTGFNMNRIQNVSEWNGDAINYDWVVQTGVPIPYDSKEESLILTLTEDGGGTLLTSTFFVHYGEINATFRTSRTNGIINAFILMSPGKDEIDIEFPGAENPGNPNTTNVNTAFQTNYFWQGYVPIGTNNGHLEQGLDDTFLNTYTHSIIWSEDTLQWAVNGSVVRTVNRADTKDKNGIYHYPTQPSQVQFSIWASGINGSAPGTIEWGGGMVNWNDPDYKSAGHFFFILDSFSIKCADATSRPANATSYVFDPSQSSSLPVWPNILYADGSTILNNTASAVAGPNLIHATVLVGMIITVLMI